jgi:hypothetical protein
MSRTVCLHANTLRYPQGGGHFWVYLNWALGLRAAGCEVLWLEGIPEEVPRKQRRLAARALRKKLAHYGFDNIVAVYYEGNPDKPLQVRNCLTLEDTTRADLLLTLYYGSPAELLNRFRRTALIDIDPGLLQTWMHSGQLHVAAHDIYFSTGETVGTVGALFPDVGIKWHYTPPCVDTGSWPVTRAAPDAPFTTISHWEASEWIEGPEGPYRNDKRAGFLPFLDLPSQTAVPLELSLVIGYEREGERDSLIQRGWRINDAWDVASTPWDYQAYIDASRGEFSCVKPSCIRFQNAWISDRSLCYLSSGKPVVVQHTGPSRLLPDDGGLLRFHTVDEAVRCLDKVEADYENQCRLARALVEAHFDAKSVVTRVLERALPQ